MPVVEETTREHVLDDPGAVLTLLETAAAVRIRGWWGADAAAHAAAAVQQADDAWVADFDGKQFAVGRAWYAHLETNRTADYFANAAAANTTVERVVPGLQGDLRAGLSAITGEPVTQRSRWAGAGVHVFPAQGLCAQNGGCVHFDHQGLTPGQRAARPPALSLVLCLQAPVSGGGLRLWDVFYGEMEMARGECVEVVSEPGDLVVFSSYRLHQIQPFGGDGARLTATVHGVRGPLQWETWF